MDVPLYGSDAAIHENITRTPFSYARSMRGLDELRKRGVRVVLHTTLFRSNLSNFPAWLNRIADMSPDAAYVQCLSDLGAADLNRQLNPTTDELLLVLRPAFHQNPPPIPFLLADIPESVAPDLSRWMAPVFTPGSAPNVMVLPYSEWLWAFRGRPRKTANLPMAEQERFHVSV